MNQARVGGFELDASRGGGWWTGGTAVVLALVALKILLHFATNGNYGYFRDELYYIACSDHLAWGYVDHPPLSIAVLAAARGWFGDSIFTIRLVAVLAGAATVYLAGVLARELGGGRFAQGFAALTVLFMPFVLGVSTMYSMNALEPVAWLGASLIAVRVVRRRDPRGWVLFGAVIGLGLLNKLTAAMFALGIVAGLLLSERRRDLWSPWMWLGGAVAVLLFLPHVYWQVANGLPTLEFMQRAAAHKIVAMSVGQFLSAQVLYAGPVATPVWIAGLVYLLVSDRVRPYRFLAVAYLTMVLLTFFQGGKAYYVASAYPILLAAGAVAIEQWSRLPRLAWLRVALLFVVAAGGLATLPMAVPILSPQSYVDYTHRLGMAPPREERGHVAELPQLFADRFGWRNLVQTVAEVRDSLPAAERSDLTIYAGNYGEAGAIDFFGPPYGLPRAVSGHNNYWLWGPGAMRGIVVAVGVPREQLLQVFDEVTQAATVVSQHALETNLPVFVCRSPKLPLPELWDRAKRFG